MINKANALFQRYNIWREEREEKTGYKIGNFLFELILSLLAVLPMIYQICVMIPFSYEVNDDSAMTQILSGSYTGSPNAHAVFLRYPLSWIIKMMYQLNPTVKILGKAYTEINWYITVFVLMETIALIAVVFRILHYFGRNRIVLAVIMSMGFLKIWLPCFSRLTFSTAGAFMGCMAFLFFTFLSEKESYRPWNILILCLLLACAYSLRKQCLYMILPFLGLAFLRKYHIQIFKKATPWLVFSACAFVLLGCNYLHTKMYSGQEWKKFAIYNHARAYLQDYGGFSKYEDHKDFFEKKGISPQEYDSIKYYRYCFLDEYSPELIEDLYLEVKAGEEKLPLMQKILRAKGKVKNYILTKEQSAANLKYTSFFMWIFLFPLILITLITQRKKGLWQHISLLLEAGATGLGLLALWFYLAMQGRFPLRVEETIRLVMLITGFALVCHYLKLWKGAALTKLHPLIQVVSVIIVVMLCNPMHMLRQMKESQENFLNLQSDKAEIIEWCADRPENIYILDTNGIVTPIRPTDTYYNSNWYVSGSWIAYSPLYKEKLALNNLENLGSETLTKDNVYIIIQKKDKPERILGADQSKEIKTRLVDTICTQTNNFYTVYHVDQYTTKLVTDKKGQNGND